MTISHTPMDGPGLDAAAALRVRDTGAAPAAMLLGRSPGLHLRRLGVVRPHEPALRAVLAASGASTGDVRLGSRRGLGRGASVVGFREDVRAREAQEHQP